MKAYDPPKRMIALVAFFVASWMAQGAFGCHDSVTINLAAEYPISPKWAALLELTTAWGGGRLFGPGANVPHEALVSVLPEIEYMATEKFSVALGVNVDLIGKNTDAAVGPLLSMVYTF